MRTGELGGRKVSLLALGTADYGGLCPAEKAFDFMDAYVDIGGNFIDTARVYGDFVTPKNGESEKVGGRWMDARGNRDRLFLSTKGGHPPLNDMNAGRLSRDEIRSDMAASLEALRTDHVDVYMLHRDDPQRGVGEIMDELNEFVRAGQTLRIGPSNRTMTPVREANA